MIRVWFGGTVVWVVAVCAFWWLSTGVTWPPRLPEDELTWFLLSAIVIGPPIVTFLALSFLRSIARTAAPKGTLRKDASDPAAADGKKR